MSTFVLVHGGWAGGFVWEKVAPLLERKGHRVLCPDLPGHGRDQTPFAALSPAAYVDCIVDILDREREPVVLVGHSSGGMIISEAAEARPDRIRSLVYVCAYLPVAGQSILAISGSDAEGIASKLVVDEREGWVGIDPAAVRDALFADVPESDFAAIVARFVPREPIAVAGTPAKLSAERFGRVPRVYIECLADRALTTALQRRMIDASPCREVLSLPTGHMPQIAAPDALAAHLERALDVR